MASARCWFSCSWEKGELTQMMGIAEDMLTLEIEVLLPVVIDHDALEVRQSLLGFHRELETQ